MGKRGKPWNSRHHLRPRSRFPPNTSDNEKDRDNIVMLDHAFHRNWHACFGNLTPEEAIEFINIIMQSGESWTRRDLHRLRKYIASNSNEDD